MKKKLNYKKVVLVMTIILVSMTLLKETAMATNSYIENKKQENIEKQLQAEKERLEREKLEEAKKHMVGVNHNGKDYSYDARIIAKKLENYDYSNNGEKIVFLTFDDGTSTTVTPQILDILNNHGVNATFFLNGKNIERGGDSAKDLVKRIFEDGNAIANHSYSHDYRQLYPNRVLNLDNFVDDFNQTDEMFNDILGPYFSTRVLRCTGGQMSWKGMDVLDSYLDENNMASVDWNALNGDAQGKKKSASELVDYAISTSEGKEIVVLLMHDTYGKEETAKALPQIIEYYKNNGYKFKVLV